MKSRRWTVSVIGMLALLALAAGVMGVLRWHPITGWPRPPPTVERLTIATATYFGSGLVDLAAAKGFFAAEGLAVTLQPHPGGGGALESVIENKADLATVGDTPVMFAVTGKTPLAIVATIARTVGVHGIIARRDRGISAPADLKGKTIGARAGTDGHFLLNMILASNGIAPDQVTMKDTGSDQLAAALSTGQVDAVSTWEPWLGAARIAAGTNGVAIHPDLGYSFGFHLAGRREFVREHPAAMQKLLRALLRAEQFLIDEPAAARAILIGTSPATATDFDRAAPNFTLRLTLDQRLLINLEDLARWAIAGRLVDAGIVPNFLDSLYLDAMLAVKPQAVSIVR